MSLIIGQGIAQVSSVKLEKAHLIKAHHGRFIGILVTILQGVLVYICKETNFFVAQCRKFSNH